jgi:hypothetical protein|tara:strand:- start:211 stop:426 length:216 start_codon:yes stop_codon:yes gene_type:complete
MPAHRATSEKILSIKSKLIIIAIMFVIINLIFYIGFDSSEDSSEESIKIVDNFQSNIKEQTSTEIVISTTP